MLIPFKDKMLCCGCAACASRCPQQCIVLQSDGEGFLYPVVDAARCLHCHLCEKVCPALHPDNSQPPLQVLAAKNKKEEVRQLSSSGGIFSLLAEKILSEKGVVFGARFDEQWQVKLTYTETVAGLSAFRGSKYVQAYTASAYADCERFLKEGRKVLFSGTPCQIAALHRFLDKDYPLLFTVDVVCHGVPSPGVWQRYLSQTLAIIHHPDKVSHFSLSFDEKSGCVEAFSPVAVNPFLQALVQSMILRPSCHHCAAKVGRAHSDISLADFWGVEKYHPEMDDGRGTSLLLIHTEKGRALLAGLPMEYVVSSYDIAVAVNVAISQSYPPHPHRSEFFAQWRTAPRVDGLMLSLLRPAWSIRIRHLFYLLRCRLGLAHPPASLPPPHIPLSAPLQNPSLCALSFRKKTPSWRCYSLSFALK